MGYRAHATRAVRDEGIDVIAHRDELGVEPPILKIQVKAQESNISADQVKAFCAMVNDRDVGVYITIGGYTAPARDFARTKGNLRLIDGVEFIDLIQKHYDRLDHRHRRLIPLQAIACAGCGAGRGLKRKKAGETPASRVLGPTSPVRHRSVVVPGLDRQDLAAAIHAGLQIDVMGAAQLARILVLDIGRGGERIRRAAETALHRRGLSFRNCHVSTPIG
jgi:hypothetical protein